LKTAFVGIRQPKLDLGNGVIVNKSFIQEKIPKIRSCVFKKYAKLGLVGTVCWSWMLLQKEDTMENTSTSKNLA
jgi:hypothetical protein